jgi:hypothetical protein
MTLDAHRELKAFRDGNVGYLSLPGLTRQSINSEEDGCAGQARA